MKARTVWELARMAECSDPDTDVSPGADFLRSIESSVRDALPYAHSAGYDNVQEWMTDTASNIADECVPVYTHNLWATFVDLAAYSEDLGGFVGEFTFDDFHKLPQVALYTIGERLALALFQAPSPPTSAPT